jgi:hypothetical protein
VEPRRDASIEGVWTGEYSVLGSYLVKISCSGWVGDPIPRYQTSQHLIQEWVEVQKEFALEVHPELNSMYSLQ